MGFTTGEISINTEGRDVWTIEASASKIFIVFNDALSLFFQSEILDTAGRTIASAKKVFTHLDLE